MSRGDCYRCFQEKIELEDRVKELEEKLAKVQERVNSMHECLQKNNSVGMAWNAALLVEIMGVK